MLVIERCAHPLHCGLPSGDYRHALRYGRQTSHDLRQAFARPLRYPESVSTRALPADLAVASGKSQVRHDAPARNEPLQKQPRLLLPLVHPTKPD